MLHYFQESIAGISLPELFTCPFHYIPHPLCKRAVSEVQTYLKSRTDWKEVLQNGKMFGVLVVQESDGGIGFLAAFSGILAGSNRHDYFVPPVYDLLHPDSFFKPEEECISAINDRIEKLETSEEYLIAQKKLRTLRQKAEQELKASKDYLKQEKINRKKIRQTGNLSEAGLAALVRDSQYQKAEYKRLERMWKQRIEAVQLVMDGYEVQLERWKEERKTRSAALQRRLFEQFRMLNAEGKVRDLFDIFAETDRKTPPAGAGECAAPKLLQYAYLHHLKPLAMAEFWWGDSPKSEVRIHGYYYPACKSKCEPILNHMLRGLEVEPNLLLQDKKIIPTIETVYEDEFLLVVNKPADMLSVPGKADRTSVYDYIKKKYPEATGPLLVHRLDMDTSGLLLVAKTKEIHARLQSMFENREVKKQYIALLDGELSPEITDKGFIRLPLRPDYEDRPRQLVDVKEGKPAVTRYEVLGVEQRTMAGETRTVTRIAYYPLTGRTHQLRVHSAHSLGMNLPIVGDTLYGVAADRLYLHASRLEFRHPLGGMVRVECKPDF